MSDNHDKCCKMSEIREAYDKMLETREKYWQFPEAALAADWKWGCRGRSPPPGSIYLYTYTPCILIFPVSDLFDLERCNT